MNFILTEHATLRIAERFPTKQQKWEKLAQKVWHKGTHPPKWWMMHQVRKGYFHEYKIFQGHVFVYDVRRTKAKTDIVLITVQKYKPYQIKRHLI